MPNKIIKVIIADDSGFMQLLIKSILKIDKQIQVIATAYNGQEAVALTKKHRPDVVLMDMMMPEYDGLFGVQNIMRECPTPIVILSTIGHKNIDPIMEALDMGAVDYLNKPEGNNAKLRTIDSEIIKKVKLAARVDLDQVKINRVVANHAKHNFNGHLIYDIIVIGSSTGGPNAVEKVLKKFPVNLQVPVVIIQHMPSNFIESFAKRLNQFVKQEVKIVRSAETLKKGKIYVLPGDKNMELRMNPMSKEVEFYKVRKVYAEYNNPSINSVMLSAAKVFGSRSLGVILTGMGRDGAEGMKAIYDNGGYTIAQDQDTSVVYGMPKAVVEMNLAKRIVPIHEMGEFIISCLS